MSQPYTNQPPHELVWYFLEALQILSLAETAKHHARQAEAHVTQHLQSQSAHNNLYTTPQDLAQTNLDALAKQSLDAHLKQVQSAQLSQASHLRLEELQTEADRSYRNRRVRITALHKKSQAITPLFVNHQNGRQTLGRKHPQVIAGRVNEIHLDKNLILVKPNLLRRWANSQLLLYVVYPLSPENLEPDVTIST